MAALDTPCTFTQCKLSVGSGNRLRTDDLRSSNNEATSAYQRQFELWRERASGRVPGHAVHCRRMTGGGSLKPSVLSINFWLFVFFGRPAFLGYLKRGGRHRYHKRFCGHFLSSLRTQDRDSVQLGRQNVWRDGGGFWGLRPDP